MKNFTLTNIKGLVQAGENIPDLKKGSEMSQLPIIKDAFLVMKNNTVQAYGKMDEYDATEDENSVQIDANGRFVFPGFCDSHTHSVFAKTRESEFVDRINGLSYEEIALKGGGILNSAKSMQEISEDELYEKSMLIVEKIKNSGTTALEIKSGYGLTKESELKMLRVY